MITIRRAEYEDIPRIMEFIDTYWKKGHILGNDRKMFEFQHVRNREVFYLLAEDDVTHIIYGTMGYIPMSYIVEYPSISTTMILCLDNPEHRLLSIEFEEFFINNIKCSNQIDVGLKKRYAEIIRKSGGNLDYLKHYYILNPKLEYRICHIEHYESLKPEYDDGEMILFIDPNQIRDQEIIFNNGNPYRDGLYIEHRYFDHPYYNYKVYGILRHSHIDGILIGREETAFGHVIFRIVDYIGVDDNLAFIGNELLRIMYENNYEYIDFYCYGIEESILKKAGFIRRMESDTNIIPNYFDPFICENINLNFHAWFLDNIHVYRGFSDQDRPNHILSKIQD